MKINFIEYWRETVSKYPQKVILTEGGRQVTVAELDAYARNICKCLDEKCPVINVPVAVHLKKSVSGVAANIAILYSGKFFFNVDVKSPDERNQKILSIIEPALIISDSTNSEKDFLGKEVLLVDSLCNRGVEYVPSAYLNLIDVDPMCIINTSGSTGIPKGVVLNHRSFIDFFSWSLSEFGFESSEVIGSLSPAVFDIYVFELTLLMGLGARMVIIPEENIPFPVRILEVLETERVTFIFWVPTIMVNIANLRLLDAHQLSSLRLAWFAGEVFPTKPFNYWFDSLGGVIFVNLYGPIEITLDCTFYVVKDRVPDDSPIPIGLACRNTDYLVLNEMQLPAKAGEIGELYIRGTSLAMGYYNNPEMTSKAFIQNPLNKSYPELIYKTGDLVTLGEGGLIYYKGRNDTMVKHSGYRVELSEIEHAATSSAKLVKNCFVLYDPIKKIIIMAYENKESLDISFIRRKLGEVIPKYMIPNKFVHYLKMPMNANGKIDRLKIKEEILNE